MNNRTPRHGCAPGAPAAVAALTMLCLGLTLAGQQQQPLRVEVRLVLLNTLVNLPSGAPASDLKVEDFRVLEDGQEQSVAVFASGTAPVHVALLMDTSGSTFDSLPLLKQAAQRFIREFGSEDHLALYDFGPDVIRLTGFVSDPQLLLRALTQLKSVGFVRDLPRRRQRGVVLAETGPRGGTMLYDALALVAEDFPAAAQRRIILVFTDGQDNASARNLEDLSRTLLRGSTVVYAVMPTVPPRNPPPARLPLDARRMADGRAKNRYTLVLDCSGTSREIEPLLRDTAVMFLKKLDADALVWVLELKGRLHLLVPPERPTTLDPRGVPAPFTRAEAMVALERGIIWKPVAGDETRVIRRMIADRVLVLTNPEHSGASRLYSEGILGRPGAVVFSPEPHLESAAAEQEVNALLEVPWGPIQIGEAVGNLREDRLIRRLRALVTDLGGVVVEVQRIRDVGDSYAQVAQLIRSSYTLGYYTKAKPGRHELRVEVPGRGVTVSSRRVLIVEK